MGDRQRKSVDDLGDLALDALRELGAGRRAERELERAAIARERDLRRERREAQQQRDLIAVGAGLLAGGLAASAGVITVAAVGVGLLAGGAVAIGLRAAAARAPAPPKPALAKPFAAPRLEAEGLSEARAKLVQQLIDEATADLKRLTQAADALKDPETRLIAARLAAAGQRLVGAVAAAPEKLGLAQRAFTYHLPKSVYLAETLAALEAAGSDAKRLAAARHVLARMENLFEKTALDLANVDAREMDVEIRLINQALDEDLAGDPRKI